MTPVERDVTEAPADVIVLPGESLAKYRRVSPMAPVEPDPIKSKLPDPPEPDTEYADAGAESEGDGEHATEEELAQEAQEIALTDLVFSTREDASAQAVEERVAGVEEQRPAETTPTEFEHAAASTQTEEQPRETGEMARFVLPDEHEPSDSPLAANEPQALDEYELRAIREGLVDEQETSLEEVDGEAPPFEEALESEPTEETPSAITEAGVAGAEQPQTATLREQGDRSMHRVSRRMRRRRGGNRLGPQGREGTVNVRGPEPVAGIGAGTAAAPEVRPETRVEPTRERSEERSGERPDRVYPSISDLLKPGQEIIVQIAKEPLGQKGARITSHIALPGRYVVFMPSVTHLGVSRKVASDEERHRLKRILQAHRSGTTGGFIVRTAGEGIPEEEIAADMNFLYSLWMDIRQKAEKKPAPALLHYDLDVVQRILRDQVTEEFKAIWVDNEDLYESVLTFMQRFQPTLVNRVKMYTRTTPIFDAFNITPELEKALRPKVWLKSGGYIVINQTEALVAIDINTGKYVGKSNRLEDTIVKTNTEAVKEIVRQIRLRDLGGIIVVDFIDMDERKNRQKVMQALEEAMRADKAPYKILQFNDFGLVAITRKRVKQSLERTLCSPCPYCEGAGYVKSVQTVISEILVEAQKIARAIEGKDVVLRVHPEVAKVLKSSDNRYLEELEEILSRPVLVVGDATLHHQKFDLG